MKMINITRTWKNASAQETVSNEECAQLPQNAIGALELTDADLATVSGASHCSHEHHHANHHHQHHHQHQHGHSSWHSGEYSSGYNTGWNGGSNHSGNGGSCHHGNSGCNH